MTDNLLNLIDFQEALISDCNYLDIDEISKYSKDDAFIVSHLNIHSLPDKYDDFSDLLNTMYEKNLLPDILLLCETFLSEKNVSRYSFDGFELISQYRKSKTRGGVSIMLKSDINYIERHDLGIFEEGKFESIFVEIPRRGKENIVVGEIYRVPGTSEADFLQNYESIVEKIRSEKKKIIIGTDQNLDYLKIHIHNNTMKFF